MKTIILAADSRGEKSVGVWLRDLGFQLVEAGAEISIMRVEGDAVRELLDSKYGMEVVQVVDAFRKQATESPRRSGATAAGASKTAGYPPHGRYGEAATNAEGGSLS